MANISEEEEFEFRRRAEQEAAARKAAPSEQQEFASRAAVESEKPTRAKEPSGILKGAKTLASGLKYAEDVGIGIGKGLTDIGTGIGQRIGDVYELAGAKRPSWAPTSEDVAEKRRVDEPLMRTAGGKVGAMLPELGTLAIPGAGTVRGAAALGAGIGALRPTTEEESVAGEAAKGAAFGGLGAAIPKAAARVLSPKAVERQKAALGELTPGQALGGIFKQAEEKGTSLPIAGHAIAKAQRKSIEGFNRGVLEKVLEPIGEKTTAIGHEGVKEAAGKLGKAYNDLLPQLKVQVDNTFDAEMKNLRSMTANLAEPQRNQFEKMLGPEGLGRKITPYGTMSGESMKEIDSELGRLSRRYSRSDDPDKQQLGDALREAQASLRSLVERSNPQHADRLRAINSGWARLVRVENAAGKTGAKGGVFTPAQLNQAVQATDESLRHRQFSHGQALFQDIAKRGEETIGSVYPDPGTAGRLLQMGAGAAYFAKPELLAGEAVLAGLYGIPMAQKALTAAVSKRPEQVSRLAEKVRQLSPTTGRLGIAAGGVEGREPPPDEEAPLE